MVFTPLCTKNCSKLIKFQVWFNSRKKCTWIFGFTRVLIRKLELCFNSDPKLIDSVHEFGKRNRRCSVLRYASAAVINMRNFSFLSFFFVIFLKRLDIGRNPRNFSQRRYFMILHWEKLWHTRKLLRQKWFNFFYKQFYFKSFGRVRCAVAAQYTFAATQHLESV